MKNRIKFCKMALHRYFKISSKLPDPNGPLSEIIPSQAIKEANEIVKQSTQNAGSTKRSRGTYQKFTPTQLSTPLKMVIKRLFVDTAKSFAQR